MSSAVQTSPSRSAFNPKTTSVSVDVETVETLRSIAPQIDTLMECWEKGTRSTFPFQASRQFMDVQVAAANAREALEQRFPEFKSQTSLETAQGSYDYHSSPWEWARGLHSRLRALEERIRNGYMGQEDPVTIRNAAIAGDFASALSVLSTVAASNRFSNFNVTDPANATALGIRSNLSVLPLSGSQE